MDLNGFETLRHYPTTSWAIWGEGGDCSVEFFHQRIDMLHARAAIVGLNRSEAWVDGLADHMRNFHTPGHQGDRRLKRHIQDGNLTNILGCLMTDVSEEIKTNSGQVIVDPIAATETLAGKLAVVGGCPKRYIVCLGDKAFHILREGLSVAKSAVKTETTTKTLEFTGKFHDEHWRVFRVWHSGNYGKFIHKSEIELAEQLRYVDFEMENSPE